MERWFPRLSIPMTWEQFRQLPQHPAYQYEYRHGVATLSPRLRRYHGLLALADRRVTSGEVPADCAIEPFEDAAWSDLPELFAGAFAGTAPFSLLAPEQRLAAAQDCIVRTMTGEFGRFVQPASFVALENGEPAAAILITLLQAGDLEQFDDPRWREPPPDNALVVGWGRPHVTWVFTAPQAGRRGLAGALLDRTAAALLTLGYTELASTFLLGNEPSLLWHWRNGFRLLSYVGSPRRIRSCNQ